MAAEDDLLRALFHRTVLSPTDGARAVIALDLPRVDLWLALMLTTVLSVLTLGVRAPFAGFPLPGNGGTVIVSPFAYAVILGSGLVMLVFLLYFAGQILGGKGRFVDILAVVAWLEGVGVVVRVIQMFASLMGPALYGIAVLAGTAFLVWCLIRFVEVAHRFAGPGRAMGTIFLSFFGVAVGIMPLLTVIGVALN